MIPEFNDLNQQEINLLLNTPALLTLLIAGAGGDIDKKEIDWGAKIAHFRAGQSTILQNYYKEVDKIFTDSLNEFLRVMPKDESERSNKINNELKKINDILPKLDPEFAKELYKSFLSLSKQVAKASGGIWGYGSISPEEQKYLDLEVIKPPMN